ncbi:MAG: hypothetical protein AAF825_00130 [Pseudomonadota bacterium]
MTLFAILIGGSAAQAQPVMVPFDLSAQEAGQLVDLRFLNHRPAGIFGRLRAEGDQLVWPDGREARFWGVNLQANALFRTKDADIEAHAIRLARMGVNLVRIHHHDSDWVRLNIFGPKGARGADLHDPALERIDRWIAALKAQGIYIWLDLHVGRLLTPDMGGLDHIDELQRARQPGDLRGFNFVNPSIKAQMQRVNAAYLGHVNRYTGLAYKDDPAIAFVLISNENDLVTHFANRLLPNKDVPAHTELFLEAARTFARAHGLPRRQIWRAWEPGAPKLFLAELEAAFFADMISHLRGLGYEGLIATSSFWGGMELSGLASLSLGDVVDVHSYGRDGQSFLRPGAMDPGEKDIFTPLAGAQLSGKPLTISEWNLSPFPASERGIAPLHMAAMAAFQGWDAPVLYGYAQRSLSRAQKPGNWHAANDPSLIATLPAAALLYRAHQLRPAEAGYAYRPDAASVLDKAAWQADRAGLRALLEQHRLETVLPDLPQLPWLRPAPSDLPDWRAAARPGPDGSERRAETRSDTGEIRRIFAQGAKAAEGSLIIDTPFAQIAAGQVAQLQLTGARVALDQPNSVVAVQSLGQVPLAQAPDVLVTLATAAVLDAQGQFQAPPLSGSLRFRGHPDLQLSDAPSGMRSETDLATGRAAVRHRRDGPWHEVIFEGLGAATWLIFSLP